MRLRWPMTVVLVILLVSTPARAQTGQTSETGAAAAARADAAFQAGRYLDAASAYEDSAVLFDREEGASSQNSYIMLNNSALACELAEAFLCAAQRYVFVANALDKARTLAPEQLTFALGGLVRVLPFLGQEDDALRAADLLVMRQEASHGAASRPVIEARVARAYARMGLGRLSAAIEDARIALEAAQSLAETDPAIVLLALEALGDSYSEAGETDQALAIAERRLALAEELYGLDDIAASGHLLDLADILISKRRYNEAVGLAERGLELLQTEPGGHAAAILEAYRVLLEAYSLMDRFDDAAEAAIAAAELSARVFGPDAPTTLTAESNHAAVIYRSGRYREALPLLERNYERRRTVLGAGSTDTVWAMANVGAARLQVGDGAGAIPFSQGALAYFENTVGPDHSITILTRGELALALLIAGRPLEALQAARQASSGSVDLVLGDADGNAQERARTALITHVDAAWAVTQGGRQ